MKLRASQVLIPVAALLFTLPVPAKETAGLVAAYKKEYAFLQAEKSSLQKRIQEFEKTAEKKTGEARGELEQLQRRLLNLRAQADELESVLADAEREVARTEESADLVQETLGRALETLRREGFEVREPTEDPRVQIEVVERIFFHAAQVMQKNGSLEKTRGTFFLADGRRTEGVMLRVGKVAAYGIAENGKGALAPAGSLRLKLWQQDASATALALNEGRAPETLGIFLYESLEKPVTRKASKTVLSIIQSGGIIAWVIVVIGCLAVILIVLRAVILLRARAGAREMVSRLMPFVKEGRRREAEAVCAKARSPAGRVLKATVSSLDRDRQQIEDVVSESILHEAPGIERFGATILVFAAIAPLLGLLGTVTGIISTFDVITEFGTGDPKLLSGGISEALVTTELGLIVAIPTLLLGTLLSGRAGAILSGMERDALLVVNAAGPRESDKEADKDKAVKPGEEKPLPAWSPARTGAGALGGLA